ncbi:MAG: NAD-dependent epimerase/dehydratase family protein [Bacteriovorax sp.]
MKVLVLGGTRYFGRHLILDLLEKGHSVIVSTRGNKDFPFRDQVNFIKADRKKLDDLKGLASLGPFDIIFDQICMSGEDADLSVAAFNNQCKRYVMTSTGSVYDFKNDHALVEGDFDFTNYERRTPTGPSTYQEDKRQAEVVFGSQNFFPVVMVRLPIVLGIDDYTERLKFHVKKIKNNEEIYFPRLDMRMSFIESSEAGRFLSFMGEHSYCGPINGASNGVISMKSLVHQISEATGRKAQLAKVESNENASPFGCVCDFMLNNGLALELGFKFNHLNDYLPGLIKAMSASI